MAWSLLAIPGVGTIATIAGWATKVVNNFRYLKGLDGAVTLSDALILPDGAGYYLHIPGLTTAQRDALTPTAGMVIYNTTTTQFNKYENGAWRADLGFNSAHTNLSGLTAGDDHTQYLLESLLTTEGDIPYATAASTWARLAKGTANQFLHMNAGATAPEWVAGVTNSKLLSHLRNMDAASGDVAYTGYGFQPKALIILAAGPMGQFSVGFGDSALAEMSITSVEGTFLAAAQTARIVSLAEAAGGLQSAVLKTLDADGFTLTWTLGGNPTDGNATIIVLALG